MSDLFEDFLDDEVVPSEKEQPIGLFGTLCKIVQIEGKEFIIYLKDGLLNTLEPLKNFLIEAELGIYNSDTPTYTMGYIEDKKEQVYSSYIIIENERPTADEIKSAKLFNDRFKQHIKGE